MLNAVVVADTHGSLYRKDFQSILRENVPEMIFCLGDIPYRDLEIIEDCLSEENMDIPVFAILGNHDNLNLLNEVKEDFFKNLTNLDCKTVDINGYTIGGFSGSIKYKWENSYCRRTQKEALSLLKDMPKTDIFLCHSQPSFDKKVLKEDDENGFSTNAHNGLYAIGEYVLNQNPRYVLHGHLHEDSVKKVGDTVIYGCYYLKFISLK